MNTYFAKLYLPISLSVPSAVTALHLCTVTFLFLAFVGADFIAAPEVTINWGNRDTSGTTEVNGNTLGEVLETLKKEVKAGNWSGEFTWGVEYKITTGESNTAKKIELTPSYKFVTPYWGQANYLPSDCRRVWEDLLNALKEHEETHAKMFEQQVDELGETLKNLEKESADKLNVDHYDKFMEKFKKDITQAHESFDSRTDHGATAMNSLTVPEECKNKPK
jgi:predicted secreted Zn-dependent protease